jgi:ATP-dependent Lon protease
MVVPLFVGREKSIRALEEAMRDGKEILLSAQKRAKTNDPRPDDIFRTGTVGTIVQLLRLPDGTVKVLVEGKHRTRIERFVHTDPYFCVEASRVEEDVPAPGELDELISDIRESFQRYVKLNKRIPPEMLQNVAGIDNPSRLADTIVAHLSLKLNDKQRVLETDDPADRLQLLLQLMEAEIEILQVERRIRSRVKKQMERTQKEYYLNEQMQQMQKEMGGERDEFKNEIDELEDRIQRKELSEEARERLLKELRKLKMMSPMSAEATVVRNYIDWVLALPWYETTEDNLDLQRAERILNEDHFGLEKPKKRILEYLSVLRLVNKLRGPILCMVGPPGVGKTSLARSIARSTGREFVRLSLGGVRDEAEIRGHRRTYIGALPGKLLQSLAKAGANNPVFLLDEIDKMTMDFRGDPASALLEVLDPEQNENFNDHYLDLDYDLSEVMFLTTANDLSQIPVPLRDRMEIIEIPGYTDYEKLHIAKDHLIPRQQEENGLQEYEISFTDPAIKSIMHRYTREAGVRNLERELASVFRKVASDIVKDGKEGPFKIDKEAVHDYLGTYKYQEDKTEDEDQIGITNGLAWTMYGGVLLTSEVTLMPGSGKLIVTGKLGDVMQESAKAALTYVRSRALNLDLSPDFYQKVDIHVHFPEGAQPKDGPSAGVTMVTSIVSALTRTPVKNSVAMTGEITLRGRVLPIGGLKEKILAAHRAGAETVIIPAENEKDLADVPKDILKKLEVITVERMDEVLREALVLEDPDAFSEKLREPQLPADVRRSDDSNDQRDEDRRHSDHNHPSSLPVQ